VKCWRREWCWIYRQSGEDRKVVGWRPTGARDSRSKWRVGRGYDQIKNVIFVVRREVNVLTKTERRKKRQKLRGESVCRIIEMNVEVTGDDKFVGSGSVEQFSSCVVN